ncbi:hypothetical protein MUK42_09265 [Musa troglodytarum]|uniref:Uncharacterized protein n=1 Tax=Musa troglodytarum TaxID=320322 RepID=A0A9E7EB21_9LILI|nr:hypothetical protein MUK42_09265 [Musa troglodytarum]
MVLGVAFTAEGRPLKADETETKTKTKTSMCSRCWTQSDMSSKGTVEGTIAPSEENGNGSGQLVGNDDVRPTNPGHSPGVGH